MTTHRQLRRSSPAKVSVVIPCYNSAPFILETLRSALAQTLREFEIVVVDDGSVDDTAKIVERAMVDNPHVSMRLVRQGNGGTAAARNRGVTEARGRYILPLDADDLIAPTMLEECSLPLDADPTLGLVYTDREDFGDIRQVRFAGKYELRHLKYFNQIPYCSLYRKSVWQAIGGYRVNVSGFDDWDFWVAAATRGIRGRHLAKPLLKHRRHDGSLMWRMLGEYERLHARIMLNNWEAYSDAEVAMAKRYLAGGEASSVLSSAKFVFLARYYDGYPRQPARPSASN
jgi:glycosyltransferase involved in cell wall biosynthesis